MQRFFEIGHLLDNFKRSIFRSIFIHLIPLPLITKKHPFVYFVLHSTCHHLTFDMYFKINS